MAMVDGQKLIKVNMILRLSLYVLSLASKFYLLLNAADPQINKVKKWSNSIATHVLKNLKHNPD